MSLAAAASRCRRTADVLALVGSLALAACDGDNLFRTGRVGGLDVTAPAVTLIQPAAGTTAPVQDSLLVEVAVVDFTGVARIELVGIAFRGDPDLGTDVEVVRYAPKSVDLTQRTPQDTVLRRYLFPTGDGANEDVSIIATVTDVAGNQGADTVTIYVGGPRVSVVNPEPGTQVRAGRDLAVRVSISDPLGIAAYQIDYAGVASGTIQGSYSPAVQSATVDTVIPVPGGVVGTLAISASAQNAFGMVGRANTITVEITSDTPPDSTAPTVALEVLASRRMELTDSVIVTITARDGDSGTGIQRLGVTALAVHPARGDTLAVSDSVLFAAPRTGTVVREFRFAPFNIDPHALPDTVVFLVHGFAVDGAGNCAAGTGAAAQTLPCRTDRAFGGPSVTTASGSAGMATEVVAVTGRTIRLPSGGPIADAVVDTVRRRLYLSNYGANRVEVLDLEALHFQSPIEVGSQPWGLFINARQDTLIVANSGGTNISFVGLNGTPREDAARRLRTPNTVLYEMTISVDATGRERLSLAFLDFSDRPQFIAQDAQGRLLYSTRPTEAAAPGTIRVVTPPVEPGALPETRLLFGDDAVRSDNTHIVIAHVDSIHVFPSETGDRVEIFTHEFGYPNDPSRIIRSGRLRLGEAISAIQDLGEELIYARSGRWDVSRIALSDTTFVAASGDRGWIAFGEGAQSPTGRVILWNAAAASVTNAVPVRDLVNNASERVNGLGLNRDGSLGVVRGQFGAYFFTPDLRLQGVYQEGLQSGGAGAALAPTHGASVDTPEERLSMVGTTRQSIRLIDTFHFIGRGEIHIRDDIVGPLRAAPPLPGDNAGLGLDDDRRVLFKVYGVTSSGGVVMVDVRRRDLALP